ncbi:GGDEF domain-containing response regulator [Pseudothauera rhizosphaerae]|uniref:Response regulator n=1 Tax=Pseudothauera rhizosphaerae TaxID=2565932 RepID=A0A4S4AMU9_9RHOO|nr:response regulator [Pseudothauera rhizosphaerae]THF60501.1 response regulator [Pseudothauera rhizosphaerae]
MSEEQKEPRPKVLIVDDSRMVRASIIKNLRDGFLVREETDGEAGWEALVIDRDIQLVITDIGMPRLDGYGLLERIRGSKLARVHDVPVVVISGEEDGEARDKAYKLGANDFITKGIGATELLARLESLTRLAQTSRELEESRAALAAQSPVDPATGLASEAYLTWHAEQELALAKRHGSEVREKPSDISAMVVEIDHYEQLVEWHGPHVAQLVTRKLSKILSTKVRKEDTVAQLAPDQFAVLSPSTDLVGCCAFALRLQKAIEKVVMTYRDERIRISVTAGVACSSVDGMQTVSHLIGLAVQRAQQGREAGGNKVVADQGEVGKDFVDKVFRQTISLDHALFQLKAGATDEVIERMGDVVATLLPLLELVESRLHCGMPLDALRQHASEAASSGEETDFTRTTI